MSPTTMRPARLIVTLVLAAPALVAAQDGSGSDEDVFYNSLTGHPKETVQALLYDQLGESAANQPCAERFGVPTAATVPLQLADFLDVMAPSLPRAELRSFLATSDSWASVAAAEALQMARPNGGIDLENLLPANIASAAWVQQTLLEDADALFAAQAPIADAVIADIEGQIGKLTADDAAILRRAMAVAGVRAALCDHKWKRLEELAVQLATDVGGVRRQLATAHLMLEYVGSDERQGWVLYVTHVRNLLGFVLPGAFLSSIETVILQDPECWGAAHALGTGAMMLPVKEFVARNANLFARAMARGAYGTAADFKTVTDQTRVYLSSRDDLEPTERQRLEERLANLGQPAENTVAVARSDKHNMWLDNIVVVRALGEELEVMAENFVTVFRGARKQANQLGRFASRSKGEHLKNGMFDRLELRSRIIFETWIVDAGVQRGLLRYARRLPQGTEPPVRVVDLGAGGGAYRTELEGTGIFTVLAMDGTPGVAVDTNGKVSEFDLTKAPSEAPALTRGNVQALANVGLDGAPFLTDIVISIEVAEHIAPEHEAAFLRNVRYFVRGPETCEDDGLGCGGERPAAQLLLSWSDNPFGIGHVNCLPQKVWHRKVEEATGLRVNWEKTRHIREMCEVDYIRHSITMFE